MERRARLCATLLAALSMAATGAGAATLDTPVLATIVATDHVACSILKVGSKPIEAVIQLRDSGGGSVLEELTVTVHPGTRQAMVNTVGPLGATSFYRHFEIKGGKKKVRANLSIGDNRTDMTPAAAY